MRMLLRIATAATLTVAALGVFAQGTPNYQLNILNPANGGTVFNNNGEVLAQASVVPGLADGDQVQMLVDGVPAAAPAASLEVPLSGINPGLHTLQARIIDAQGNAGPVSPSSTFNLWHASRLYPNRHK